MEIRPAVLSTDKHAIFNMAVEQTVNYPELKPDVEKISDLIRDAIAINKHFTYVAEHRGEIVGVLIGLTSANLWAQRSHCFVPLWVSRHPGAGAALLRRFRAWVRERRGIRVAGFSPDFDIDGRVIALAERIGFKRHGGACLFYN